MNTSSKSKESHRVKPRDAMLVLVPTDFSETADHGLDYAVSLARRLQAQVALLHVLESHPAQLTYPGGRHVHPDLRDEIVIEAEALLRGLMERYPDQIRPRDCRVLLDANPGEAIAGHARAIHADMVVMGTHSRTGVPHFFLGSVAEDVIRKGPCPVLTVGPGTQPEVVNA